MPTCSVVTGFSCSQCNAIVCDNEFHVPVGGYGEPICDKCFELSKIEALQNSDTIEEYQEMLEKDGAKIMVDSDMDILPHHLKYFFFDEQKYDDFPSHLDPQFYHF